MATSVPSVQMSLEKEKKKSLKLHNVLAWLNSRRWRVTLGFSAAAKDVHECLRWRASDTCATVEEGPWEEGISESWMEKQQQLEQERLLTF